MHFDGKIMDRRLTTAQSIAATVAALLLAGTFWYCRHMGWWQVTLGFALVSVVVWIVLLRRTVQASLARAKSRDTAIFYILELAHLLGLLGLIVCLTMRWDHFLAMIATFVPKAISRLMFGNDPPTTEAPAPAA